MKNETRHAYGYNKVIMPLRRRAASATVVSKHAQIRAKWARRHEKVDFFSIRQEENDNSQSEKQYDTSERFKIRLASYMMV
jgi:hypothetical protein